MKNILLVAIILFMPSLVTAQATQFYLEDTVGKGLKARIYVVADMHSQPQVQQSLYQAVDHARRAYQGYRNELMGIASKGTYSIGRDSATLVETGLRIAKKTGGAYDIATGPYRRNYQKVGVRRGGKVHIRAEGIRLNLDNILRGGLADIIIRDLATAGWSHALVKIGTVFVSRGNDANGPWKIPVMSPTRKLAARMLFYKAQGDVGAATYPKSSQKEAVPDPRTQEAFVPDLNSATLFGTSGAEAEALSQALYIMGAEAAENFLKKNKGYRGVLNHLDGQYTHIPEFGLQSNSRQVARSLPRISRLKKAKEPKAKADRINDVHATGSHSVEDTL